MKYKRKSPCDSSRHIKSSGLRAGQVESGILGLSWFGGWQSTNLEGKAAATGRRFQASEKRPCTKEAPRRASHLTRRHRCLSWCLVRLARPIDKAGCEAIKSDTGYWPQLWRELDTWWCLGPPRR